MKNLLGLLLLTLLMTSCGKDLADDIVDTWNAKSVTYANCEEADENQTVAFDENGCISVGTLKNCIQYVFNEGGSFTQSTTLTFETETETETDSGTYSVDGENVTITVDGDTITGTATIDGDTMTLTGQDDGCDLTIVMTRAS